MTIIYKQSAWKPKRESFYLILLMWSFASYSRVSTVFSVIVIVLKSRGEGLSGPKASTSWISLEPIKSTIGPVILVRQMVL